MSELQQGPEICDVISAKRYYTCFLKSRVTKVFSLEVKKYVSEILYFQQMFPQSTQYAEYIQLWCEY